MLKQSAIDSIRFTEDNCTKCVGRVGNKTVLAMESGSGWKDLCMPWRTVAASGATFVDAVKRMPVSPTSTAQQQSIHRRIAFATNTRLLLDSTAALPAFRQILGRGDKTPWHYFPEKAARICFDLLESLRTGGRVPDIGDVRKAALSLPTRLPQHPRYRGYWYDPGSHSLVGLHLGIDLIRHRGKYHVVENNMSAAMKDRRRAIYDQPIDPVVSGLAGIAKTHGFETLVAYARQWPDWYLEEFAQAERDFGLRITPTSVPYVQPNAPHPMTALPARLAANTIYAVFPYRGGPLDYFVDDKHVAGGWLTDMIDQHGEPDSLLAAIPSSDRLFVPPLDEAAPWPNLVVKLSGSGGGEHVLAGRFRDEVEARAGLGLTDADGLPGMFKLHPFARLVDRLFHTLTTVYQPFIPPEIDADGHPETLRMHVFVSPLVRSFLSAHRFTGPRRVPETASLGLMVGDDTFIVKYARGARYARLSRDREREIEAAADEFGRLLDIAVRERFEIGPTSADQQPYAVHRPAASQTGGRQAADPGLDIS